MQIKIFEGKYDRKKFYSIMGKYFAEPVFKKAMPYMVNKETSVWFLVFEMNKLLGFGSLTELKDKVVFESSYVEEEYRKQGIWKELNEVRLKYSQTKNKPVEVITKEEYLLKYWGNKGFEVYRQNGRYFYLRKEKGNETN
jgi:predicted GNAT family acetyltransferase